MPAASLALTASAGAVSVTGSNLTGTTVQLVVTFAATNSSRRYAETYTAPVVAGVLSAYSVKAPYTGGTVTVKAVDNLGAVLATASVAV